MKSIQIIDSYKIWRPSKMYTQIWNTSFITYGSLSPSDFLNRSYKSMYIEWWLHNIGYYITKPFCRIPFVMSINMRCADVDLEERL